MNLARKAIAVVIVCPIFLAAGCGGPVARDFPLKGTKWPNSVEEGTQPVETYATAANAEELGGFNDLLPYVMRAPDQDEAGSCLYMALTGVAEWWMHKLKSNLSMQPDGPGDLSERYLMNLSGVEEDNNGVPNWKTDSIFLFNKEHRSVLNTSYRFTKDWYKPGPNGSNVPAKPHEVGATFGTSFNWIDQRNQIKGGYVSLPNFQRKVVFADPESNQWNVGVAPSNLVDNIKKVLRDGRHPVQVVYNHFGYWHAVYIIGYDDEHSSESCKFVERMRTYMHDEPLRFRKLASKARTAAERDDYIKRAEKIELLSPKLERAYAGQGGCHPKGMFYVRDSIYADPKGPQYDYNLAVKGDEAPYATPIILHEYDWVRYLVNHATEIFVSE